MKKMELFLLSGHFLMICSMYYFKFHLPHLGEFWLNLTRNRTKNDIKTVWHIFSRPLKWSRHSEEFSRVTHVILITHLPHEQCVKNPKIPSVVSTITNCLSIFWVSFEDCKSLIQLSSTKWHGIQDELQSWIEFLIALLGQESKPLRPRFLIHLISYLQISYSHYFVALCRVEHGVNYASSHRKLSPL